MAFITIACYHNHIHNRPTDQNANNNHYHPFFIYSLTFPLPFIIIIHLIIKLNVKIHSKNIIDVFPYLYEADPAELSWVGLIRYGALSCPLMLLLFSSSFFIISTSIL